MVEDKDLGLGMGEGSDISSDPKNASEELQNSLFPGASKSGARGGETVSTSSVSQIYGVLEQIKSTYEDVVKRYEKVSLKHFRASNIAKKRGRVELSDTCNKAAEWSIRVVSSSKKMIQLLAEPKKFQDRKLMIPEFGKTIEEMLGMEHKQLAPILLKAVAETAISEGITKQLQLFIVYALDRKIYLRQRSSFGDGIDIQLLNDFKRALVDMPKEDMQQAMKELPSLRDDKEKLIAFMKNIVAGQKKMGVLEQFQLKVLKYLSLEKKEKVRSILNKIPKRNHAGIMKEIMSIRDNMIDDRLKEMDEKKRKGK